MNALAAVLVLLTASPSPPRELGGHELPDTARVGDRTLVLNGAGIRKKLFFFPVYVCALYLEERSLDPASVLDADRAWQVTLHFMRSVGHHQVLDVFHEAFQQESPGQVAPLNQELERFHAVMEDVKQGQDLTISYLPGVGTTLRAPTGSWATVPGKGFADAVLRTWLGRRPADPELKERILGR
jgi:hypothetical protein